MLFIKVILNRFFSLKKDSEWLPGCCYVVTKVWVCSVFLC